MIEIQLFCLVAVSYVATLFHVGYSYGLMSKSVKSSQRCDWLTYLDVTQRYS